MEKSIELGDVHDANFETKVFEIWERDIANFVASSRSEFKATPCPACLSDDGERFTEARGFTHLACPHCGTLFISPCPTDEMIVSYIEQAPNYQFWHEHMPERVKASRARMYADRAAYVVSKMPGPGLSLIEFGAGRGEMAADLYRSGLFDRITLIDPQPIDVDLPGVEAISSGFETAIDSAAYDVAVAFEVLEHIVDPSQLIQNARRSLKAGGLLILSTPNGASYEVDLLREKSNQVPFEHVRLYNPKSMATLLQRFGFDVISAETPGAFDADILMRKVSSGDLDLGKNDALRFALSTEETRRQFQEHLRSTLRSSHMKCIARAV